MCLFVLLRAPGGGGSDLRTARWDGSVFGVKGIYVRVYRIKFFTVYIYRERIIAAAGCVVVFLLLLFFLFVRSRFFVAWGANEMREK